MSVVPSREGVACPECGLTVPVDDTLAQIVHMERDHPEVIEERLLAAGFRRLPDGKWLDTLSGDG